MFFHTAQSRLLDIVRSDVIPAHHFSLQHNDQQYEVPGRRKGVEIFIQANGAAMYIISQYETVISHLLIQSTLSFRARATRVREDCDTELPSKTTYFKSILGERYLRESLWLHTAKCPYVKTLLRLMHVEC